MMLMRKLTLLVLLVVPSDSLASTIYTTSIAGNSVNVHDTASNTVVTYTVPSPRFVAVDPITGQAYWNTENPRHMMTVSPGSAPEILFSTSLNANEIAVDHFSGHLYWAEQTTIKRANLDGTDPTTVVTGISNAIGLDLDLSRGHLYFTDYNAGNIYRTNLDGSAQTLILSESLIYGLEIDSVSRHIYWTQGGGAGAGVYRSDIDGSPHSRVTSPCSAFTLGQDGAGL